jgi:hypothetical protein
MMVNDYANPRAVLPQTSTIKIAPKFTYEAPAHSVTVIRVPKR